MQKRLSDCVFYFPIFLPAWTQSLKIFVDISKTLPYFEMKFLQVSFIVHLYRIKTIERFQKPKVYFAFKGERSLTKPFEKKIIVSCFLSTGSQSLLWECLWFLCFILQKVRFLSSFAFNMFGI